MFVFLLLFISCSEESNEEPNEVANPASVEFTEIYKTRIGSLAESTGKQNVIITNETEWNLIKETIDVYNPNSDYFLVDDVDFSTHTVLVSIDQLQSNTGYFLNITDVINDRTKITVNVEYSITENDLVGYAMTQPIHIIMIENTDLPIEFNEIYLY